MKFKTIDLEFLNKFTALLDKCNRTIPVGSTKSCEKVRFVNSVMKRFIIHNLDKAGVYWIPTKDGWQIYTGYLIRVEFVLGWSDSELCLTFWSQDKTRSIKLDVSELQNIKYREMTLVEKQVFISIYKQPTFYRELSLLGFDMDELVRNVLIKGNVITGNLKGQTQHFMFNEYLSDLYTYTYTLDGVNYEFKKGKTKIVISIK